MVEINEIVDRESLEAWLEAQSGENRESFARAYGWAISLADRAALRVLPLSWGWMLSDVARALEVSPVLFLRASLICGVGGERLSPMIRTAADGAICALCGVYADMKHAGYAENNIDAVKVAEAAVDVVADGTEAFFSTGFVASDAAAASDAAKSTAITGEHVWDMVRTDCRALITGMPLNRIKLWHDTENPLAADWRTLRAKVLTKDPFWQFWVDWYDNALNGEAQDWDLLTKIALIDPTDWDNKDPDHVNGIIARMVEQRRLELEAARL